MGMQRAKLAIIKKNVPEISGLNSISFVKQFITGEIVIRTQELIVTGISGMNHRWHLCMYFWEEIIYSEWLRDKIVHIQNVRAHNFFQKYLTLSLKPEMFRPETTES